MELPLPWPALRFLALSRTGVELFFVLSGFLIGGILIDNKHSSRYFRTFYVRRFFRIFPVYVALCFLVVLGLALARQLGSQPFISILDPSIPWYAYATFAQNIWVPIVGNFGGASLGVTWSLAVEEHFYITLPLVVWALRRRPALLAAALGAAVLAAPFIRVMLILLGMDLPFDGDLAAQTLAPARADELALGVLGAMAIRSDYVRGVLVKHRIWILVVALACAYDLLLPTLATGSLQFGAFTLGDFLPSRLGIFYLCLLLSAVLFQEGVTARVMRNRILVQAGIVAYGAYLLHRPILFICFALILGKMPAPVSEISDVLVITIAFISTMALAMLSWSYFEKPLVKLGHRFKY